MRCLLVFGVLFSAGCIEDAAPTASGDPNTAVDAEVPSNSGEAAACCTDDWLCVEGAPDAGSTVVPDGAKPPGDGVKPPKGDFREGLIQKKQAGWYGIVDDEQSVYGYLNFGRGVLTCDVVYRWSELEMVDDCADCAFAQSGVLGAPAVEIDNVCGEALTLEGATVAFGHGLQPAPFPGFFELHRRADGQWTQAGFSQFQADDGWSFFTTEEGGMEMPEMPEPAENKGGGWDVQLNRETGQGEYAYQARNEAGELVCDLFFPIVDAVANDACDTCAFAYDLPLGNREVRTDGPACGNAYDLSGLTLTAGHVEPSTLVFFKEGLWRPVSGAESGVEGAIWRFVIEDN